jgi:hypothetical protein
MKIFFFCLLLIGGCAAKTVSLPPQNMQPVQAQFGMRFISAGMTIPLQGAMVMEENEGSLAVIFPHGLTLGVCRYQDGGMECVPAGGGRHRARVMLQQIGLAVYRSLSALTPESTQDIVEKDWAVYWQDTSTGWSAEYLDSANQITIEMHFTEITLP